MATLMEDLDPLEPPPAAEPAPGDLREALLIACFSLPTLLVYAVAQSCIYFLLGPNKNGLKLMLEPYLLILGFILHVQWRRVAHIHRYHGQPRPTWMLTGDCFSFVITFWALWTLVEAFLREAKLI
jgi:hypothetical protein